MYGRHDSSSCAWPLRATTTMRRPALFRRGLVSARRQSLTESHMQLREATRQCSELLRSLVGFEVDDVELRIGRPDFTKLRTTSSVRSQV
jgi:hypothetical protein